MHGSDHKGGPTQSEGLSTESRGPLFAHPSSNFFSNMQSDDGDSTSSVRDHQESQDTRKGVDPEAYSSSLRPNLPRVHKSPERDHPFIRLHTNPLSVETTRHCQRTTLMTLC